MTNIQFILKLQQQLLIFKKRYSFYKKTVHPFISRYRKDTTGNLDEVQIENIAKLQKRSIVKEKKLF
jgi:uncharacterized protein